MDVAALIARKKTEKAAAERMPDREVVPAVYSIPSNRRPSVDHVGLPGAPVEIKMKSAANALW